MHRPSFTINNFAKRKLTALAGSLFFACFFALPVWAGETIARDTTN